MKKLSFRNGKQCAPGHPGTQEDGARSQSHTLGLQLPRPVQRPLSGGGPGSLLFPLLQPEKVRPTSPNSAVQKADVPPFVGMIIAGINIHKGQRVSNNTFVFCIRLFFNLTVSK